MFGPDWALDLVIIVLLGGLALAVAGLVLLLRPAWRRRETWWRWPALALITWLALGTGILLAVLIAEASGFDTGSASDYSFVLSLAAVALAGLPFWMWRVWRRPQVWWRWPALIGIGWLMLSAGAVAQQLISDAW